MKSDTPISTEINSISSDELYEMANFYPRTNGLPMTVWVGPRGNARHDVRIKVNQAHGDSMTIDNTAVIGVRPSRYVITGRLLSADDRRAVFDWLALNKATIIAYWDGSIDPAELIQALKPLPPAP